MTEKNRKLNLVFVYNADSGVFSLAADIAHKMFSPQTYACNLCALTHSNFGMKKEWKNYLESLDADFEFLHADEFKDRFKSVNAELPAIFKKENSNLVLIADAPIINQCMTIEDLSRLLEFQTI